MTKLLRHIFVGVIMLYSIISNAQTTYTLGTGTTTNTTTAYPSPYANYYQSARQQYLVLASELNALGMTGASKISSLGFNVSAPSGASFSNFTISLKSTTLTALTTTFETGLTTVVNPRTYADVAGWNMHNFDNVFCWDGTSNIVVEICHYTTAGTLNNATVFNSVTAFNSDHWLRADGASQCGIATGGTVDKNRPNMRFVVSPANPDIAAIGSTAPASILTLGSNNVVSLTFKNFSCPGTTFTTASLGFQVDNTTPVIEPWSGSLAVGASTTYNFLGQANASSAGLHKLKIWVNKPNGLIPDAVTSNDTITKYFYVDAGVTNPGGSLSSNDFWFTMPLNSGAVAVSYDIIITSQYCAQGKVVFPKQNNLTQTFKVTPNSTTTVTVANPFAASGQQVYNEIAGAVEGKGFHVTSDSAVNVYIVPYVNASVDAENVMPTSYLGNAYVVQSRAWSLGPVKFVVGATQDGTTVQVFNNSTKQSRIITLDAGQTYMESSSEGVGDTNCYKDKNSMNFTAEPCWTLNGSTVISDKPIYVMGHADCSRLTSCGACDQIMAQMLPINYWGKKYILAQPLNRQASSPGGACVAGLTQYPTGGFIEILGKAGTSVSVTNKTATTNYTIPAFGTSGYGYLWILNPRVAGDGSGNGEPNVVITSLAPIQVVQYEQDSYTDGTLTSDPEMMLIYPESFWQNGYVFAGSARATNSSNLCVVVDDTGNNIGSFVIDGTAQAATGWFTIGPNPGPYKFKRVSLPITANTHTITNTKGAKFGIYVNAVGAAESYTSTLGGSPLRLPLLTTCTFIVGVELLDFSGSLKDGKNYLYWRTATETNNKEFIIERSVDQVNFVPIGSLRGFGNSTSTKSYDFVDSIPFSGYNYYRLKQIDFDGKFEYSSVIYIENPIENQFKLKATVFNELSKEIELNVFTQGGQDVEIEVYSAVGVKMSKMNLKSQSGTNIFKLETEGFATGIYHVKVRSGETIYNSKVFVK